MTERIYIVIPIYNAEKHLKKCLDSIKNQTHSDFRCIMVNDGSTDSSEKICASYTADNRFVLLNQKNSGPSAARNNGMEHIFSISNDDSFLTFIDSDDFIESEYLKSFVSSIEECKSPRYETVHICGWNEIQDENTTPHLLNSYDKIILGSIKADFKDVYSFFQTPWGKLYNVGFLREKKIRFNEKLRNCEDCFFNCDCLKHIRYYAFVNTCLYNYNVFSDSLSHNGMADSESDSHIYIDYLKSLNTVMIEQAFFGKPLIMNNQITSLIFRKILTPYYRQVYELKDYSDLTASRTYGQKRVIFCLKHNLLWVYRLYLKFKAVFDKS